MIHFEPFYQHCRWLCLVAMEDTILKIHEQENIKTIFDARTGELLGAHMIGSDVTELIHGYVISKSMEGIELDFIEAILPHPTLSEMLHESVLQAYDKPIHI